MSKNPVAATARSSSIQARSSTQPRSVQSASASAATPAVYRPATGHGTAHISTRNPAVAGHGLRHGSGFHRGNGSAAGDAALARTSALQAATGETRPRNRLLCSLGADEWERLSPHLGRTLLIEGQNLNHPGQAIERVYFPNTGLVSLVVNARDGSQVEVGVAGREGLAGDLSVLCGGPSQLRAIVQAAGTACWLPAAVVREEFRRGGAFQQNLLQHFQMLTSQSAQCALCNRLHSVEERLSRWLMVIRDRLETDEIDITHEFIAHMLGTRRSGVTVALGVLQQAGLIDITRGHISIRDAGQLAASACECYGIISKQFHAVAENSISAA